MDAAALLRTLRERGFTLRVEGGTLYVGHQPGALTDELRSLIREHKTALLALLSAGEAGQEEAQSPPAPAVPPDRILSAPPLGRGGGLSLTRADGITLALSLQPDGTCYCCKGSRWWVSRYGVLICATCHPQGSRMKGGEQRDRRAWLHGGRGVRDSHRRQPGRCLAGLLRS